MTHLLGLRTGAWYGDAPLRLEVPPEWEVQQFRPTPPPPLADREVAQALEQPVGQPPIRELARGKRRPLIIVDDLTRPTPAARVMPLVLAQLAAAGIPSSAVTILLATGTHGAPPPDGPAKKVGREAASTCRIVVHDSRRDVAYVGRTSIGTPVSVHRAVLTSDFVIGIGGVYPQHSTGFGGGSKLALGVLGRRSIIALHYGHPGVGGSYDVENSFRRDLDEVAGLIGLATLVTLHVDADREVVRVVSGDHRRYYAEAVDFSRRHYLAPLPGDADVVISCAYPMDTSLTFMRSKGIIPLLWTAPGASRIMVAACSEGVGYHGLYPFANEPRYQRQRHLLRRLSVVPPRAIPREVAGRAARRLRSVSRRLLDARPKQSASPAHPIRLYCPGLGWDSLPAHIPGMVRAATWPEVIDRVRAEQGGRDSLRLVVYPCAPLQVLDLAARSSAGDALALAALE